MSRISPYNATEEKEILCMLIEITNRDVTAVIKTYTGVFFDFDLLMELMLSAKPLEGDDYGDNMDQYSLMRGLINQRVQADFYTLRCPSLGRLIQEATN